LARSQTRIIFLSHETSIDVVQAALATGAHGYVVKTDAGSELQEGVNAVLRGDQFVSRRFSGHDFVGASDERVSHRTREMGERHKSILSGVTLTSQCEVTCGGLHFQTAGFTDGDHE
jgi:DNA-binding NarL/FixJ family response regulator